MMRARTSDALEMPLSEQLAAIGTMVQSEASATLDEGRFVATDDDFGSLAKHAEPVKCRGFREFFVVINECEEDGGSAPLGVIGVDLEVRRDRDPGLVERGVGKKFLQEHVTGRHSEVITDGNVPDLHPGEALDGAHRSLWAEDRLNEGSIREDGGGCKQAGEDEDKVARLSRGSREAALQDFGWLSELRGEQALKFPNYVRLVAGSEGSLLSFIVKSAVPKDGEFRSVRSLRRAGVTALGAAGVRSVGSALYLACGIFGGLMGMDGSIRGVSDER